MSEQHLTGEATGHNGIISYEIDVDQQQIEDFKILSHSETPGIFNQVMASLKKRILENQSFEVDTISGATVMTKALLDSAKAKLAETNLNVNSHLRKQTHQDKRLATDVVVIGGGEAGLVAAIRALSLGNRVTLVEKNGYLGGATILNGSNVVATGSKTAARIFGDSGDRPEKLVADVSEGSQRTNVAELTNLMANNIGEAVDFISDTAELHYQRAQTQTPEHRIDRQIELPSASSYELIKKLTAIYEEKGGELLLDARVEAILRDDDNHISGIMAESKNQTITIQAKAVILAAGGYGANQKMRGDESKGLDYYGPMTSTGDAYQFNEPFNLATRHLNWYKVYPHGVEVEPGIAKLTTYASKKATDLGALYVNQFGRRIVNESAVYADFRDAILQQPGKVAFMLMDKRTWQSVYDLLVRHDFTAAEIQGYFDHQNKRPIFAKGSLKDVARAAEIDENQLIKTVADYQQAVEIGKDSEFSRDPQYLHRFEGDEFYIVEQRDRFATTLGGYVINPVTMQLVDQSGKDISNYFAAGEVVGGANGHDSLPSMMNSWSISSGYLAGSAAAKAVQNQGIAQL